MSEHVQSLAALLTEQNLDGVYECIPGFRSLAIDFNPLVITYTQIQSVCNDLLNQDQLSKALRTRVHAVIPVLYGGEMGPDLEEISKILTVTPDEVVKIHSDVVYHVYMVGFSNGFAYMGDTNELLNLPRRLEPRLKVPVGSIAVAMKQTGIYPLTSPGGWHLIGRTPIPMFDPMRETPAFLAMGTKVTFKPIDLKEYQELEGQVHSEGADIWSRYRYKVDE